MLTTLLACGRRALTSMLRVERIRRVTFGALIGLFVFACAPTVAHSETVTYEHDANGRLKKATYGNGTVVDYTYDANGNRTGAVVTTPPPDTTPPSAPGTPTVSGVTMTSATASWTAATDNVAVVGYDYRLNSGAWQSLGNVLSANLTGLSAATNYTFQVRARDAATNIGPASSRTFTTPDTAAPSVPTGLSAAAPTSTKVSLSWNASTDNVGVTGYKIFRNGGQIGTSATTSYADNTVSGTTTYSYRVSAYDAATNNSAQSNAVNVTTPDTIAPSTPTGLSASAVSPTRVNLSWSASSDSGGSGLAGYRIYRGGSFINSTSATSYSDTTVAGSTTYSYTVAAYDNANNPSGLSNTATATTPPVLQATLNRTTWSYNYQQGQPLQVSPNVVVTATGGTGTGYTYTWERVSGDTLATVQTPTVNSAKWTHPLPSWHVTYTSVWRCRVTDSSSATTYTPNVTVTFLKENLD